MGKFDQINITADNFTSERIVLVSRPRLFLYKSTVRRTCMLRNSTDCYLALTCPPDVFGGLFWLI